MTNRTTPTGGTHDEPVNHDRQVGGTYPPHHPSHDARYPARWWAAIGAAVMVTFAGIGVHDLRQQRDERDNEARRLTNGGDPTRGRALLRPFGCAGCHVIPGVTGADGTIGPPLAGIANRMYVGGVITNTPDHLIAWIRNPKAIDPKSAMPAVGVSEAQARDIAAYLYILR